MVKRVRADDSKMTEFLAFPAPIINPFAASLQMLRCSCTRCDEPCLRKREPLFFRFSFCIENVVENVFI